MYCGEYYIWYYEVDVIVCCVSGFFNNIEMVYFFVEILLFGFRF